MNLLKYDSKEKEWGKSLYKGLQQLLIDQQGETPKRTIHFTHILSIGKYIITGSYLLNYQIA